MTVPNCPTCDSEAIRLGAMQVTIGDQSPESMVVYQCTNSTCTMTVPYPEGMLWRTEFVLIGEEKHLVRPSAGEFS